ncbi:MAG: UTP--glucose-1-phosphate uridylyltransferase [Polyangiales bacterium]
MAALELDSHTNKLLEAYGFDRRTFERLRDALMKGEAREDDNRLHGHVEPPRPEEVVPLPKLGSPARRELAEIGNAAIERGEVGCVVLAGGMATRFGGCVKGDVPAVQGHTFLELKLRDAAAAARHADGRVPVYLMTSFATHFTLVTRARTLSLGVAIEAFPQHVSVRLTPEGDVFREADGSPSLYAPGHGDLTFALRESGTLRRFREGGGRMLFMTNVDNLTATLDPAIIGAHVANKKPLTVEVAPKLPGDRGGAPASVDGVLQIVESFRFPKDFDQDRIPVFNTNTMVLDAEAIDRDFPLTWFAVRKTVDGRTAIQFERLVGELTAFLPTTFLGVERDGLDARFQPAKDPEELAQRAPMIEAVLSSRGIL